MSSLAPWTFFILGALVLPFVPQRLRPAGFLAAPLLAFFSLLNLSSGSHWVVPFLDMELVMLRVDRLSMAFGYVFVIMAFLGGVYAFHVRDTSQQVGALLYAGSSVGVVFAGDLLTLFLFWEIMAISAVMLIWARGTQESSDAGMRYLLVHFFGGSVLLAGILLHLVDTGSLLFNLFEGGAAANLILFGFALNAAIPPLHAWLADAYPEATVTGSVFLSGFTTKVAVYVLCRGFAGYEILIWGGVIMALYGVVFAVLENDIRRLLAYHIVSQVGFMVAAVGIGTETAINGATAHAFAHVLYKGLLFMGAGAVLYTTGRSKLTELGGLYKAMPLIAGLYMIGAFSISGFPLMSGFVSKSIVVYAAELSSLGAVVLLLNLASVGTFLHTGLKLPYFTWWGPDRKIKPGPAPTGMYVGMALTAAGCVAIGVYPALLYNLLPHPIDYAPYSPGHLAKTMQLLAFTAFGFWFLIEKLGGEATITVDTDWVYRRPAAAVYRLLVGAVQGYAGILDRHGSPIVTYLVEASRDPVARLQNAASILQAYFKGPMVKASGSAGKPPPFNPDLYRGPFGYMLAVVLVFMIVLSAWAIVASLAS